MKKEYVKPEMVVEQFMAEIAFLDASGSNVGGDVGDGGIEETNSHRGSWGDLWN